MKKTKTQKGITLVALIITIIVLLILAIVAIRAVQGDGILGKAKESTTKYEDSKLKEQGILAQYEYELAKAQGQTTGTFTDYVLETKYNGIKIGDKVNYNEGTGYTYTTDTTKGIGGSVGTQDSTTKKYQLNSKTYTTEDLTWRVLGVNSSGQIELISENPMSDSNEVYLANEEGYLYGPDELDKMCNELYGKGTGATGGRSLKVEDIDKLAGITEENKKAFDSNYGTKWTYRFPETGSYMQYKKISADGAALQEWTDVPISNFQTFRMPGTSETISSSNRKTSEELTCTYYDMHIAYNMNKTTSDGKNMLDIITKGTGTNEVFQWLASRSILCDSRFVNIGVRRLNHGGGSCQALYVADGYCNYDNYRLRPVVTLSSDMQLSGSSSAGWCITQ